MRSPQPSGVQVPEEERIAVLDVLAAEMKADRAAGPERGTASMTVSALTRPSSPRGRSMNAEAIGQVRTGLAQRIQLFQRRVEECAASGDQLRPGPVQRPGPGRRTRRLSHR